jgi:hypothetical protein
MLKRRPPRLRPLDRRLLLAVIEKFDGGPVGVDSLAAALGEERGTIEDVLEPFLIQQGYMVRTPRGRMVTRSAYRISGSKSPAMKHRCRRRRRPCPWMPIAMNPDAVEFSLPLRVYIEDTDAGGIVFYVNYLKYMERARTEFMRSLGLDRERIFNAGLMFVVTRAALDYHLPARLDDELTVTRDRAPCAAPPCRSNSGSIAERSCWWPAR